MCKPECYDCNHLMSRILEVRYTDLKEEKNLCDKLLERAEKEGYSYGQFFAHAFLGDYYIAMNEVDTAGEHLLKALFMCDDLDVDEYDNIRLKLYTFLGIYYGNKGDDQSAIQYYLYADAIARHEGDILTECLLLNNIAFSFQRHNSAEKALEFYLEAYERQKELESSAIILLSMSNLIEILIYLNRLEEALTYINKYDHIAGDKQEKEKLRRSNMCLYYAKLGNKEECLKWMEEILDNLEVIDADRMMAFENYTTFFEAMAAINHKKYAKKFLDYMERFSYTGSLDQRRILEKKRIQYYLKFEDESQHYDAYERFYIKMLEFKSETDRTIADAMKTMIYLGKLQKSTEKIKNEHDNLTLTSITDDLTGIYNRRYFDNTILKYSQEPQNQNVAVIMCDVDYFKEYNDYYSHHEGDKVLVEVAKCLHDNKIDGIHPCRYGGDEFVCICTDISKDSIINYIHSVRKCLTQKAIKHEKSPCSKIVTLSIGFAIGKSQNEVMIVMEMSDNALYESKKSGRNTVTENQVSADV